MLILIILLFTKNALAQNQDSTGNSIKYPPNSTEIIPALNFKDTDMRDVLRAIALEYKTNIVVDNQINKKISVALFMLPLLDAVQIIAEDNGYEFSFDEQRFFVKTITPKPAPPPPPPPKEPEPVITFYNDTKKIDILADNVDIKLFVNKLREATGYNYLLTNGTSGKITGTLNEIEFKTGLRNLLQNNGFYFIEKDSIFYVSRSAYYSSLQDQANNNVGVYWVSVQNNLVTLDISKANLNKVLDDISNQLNLQVIKVDVPENDVTIKCSAVPVDKAFYYLFKGSEFTFKKEHDAYIIGKTSKKGLETVKLIKLNYLRADKVIEQIPKQLFPSVNVQKIIEHNGLLINGPQDELTLLQNYLSEIDKPVPQVMIEALVIDYNLDNLFDFGLSAGTGDSTAAARPDKWFPGLDVTASGKKINGILKDIGSINLFGQDLDLAKVTLPDNFYANVRFLESNGIANIKSRPLLSTLNGHTASLKIGTTQNYVFNEILPVSNQLSSTFIQRETIQKLEANISFEITPWVGTNGELTLEIKPEFQTPVGQFSPDKRLIPSINTRSFDSTVKLKDGETIVLGGLIQDSESTTESKFPLLGDIPLLGELFTSRSKKNVKAELIIYLTPRIFYEEDKSYSYYEYAEE